MLCVPQIICSEAGNTTLSALEAWLNYQGPDTISAEYQIQPDSTVEVASAALPQVQSQLYNMLAGRAGC